MQHSRLKAFIVVLFALSGISGLVYEITWSKYLSLFMGSTAYSNMIVLATFMGGLALGAAYWGKIADRSKSSLRLYGWLEVAVGIYCAAYPALMIVCEKIFITAASDFSLSSHQFGLVLLKFVLSIFTLLIPTFCMGGTLPVLIKLLTRTAEESGKSVATLYWVNSFGAVVGAVLAGFFLIRLYTLDGAIWIAAGINIFVGLISLLLAKNMPQQRPEIIQDSKSKNILNFSPSIVRIAIITAILSGLVSMIYELTWIRLLVTLLGSSTYSFTIMLIAFISGITLGSWIISLMIHRWKNIFGLLAWCQIGTAFFMIATLPLYERLRFYLWKLSMLMSNTPDHFPLFLFYEFTFCFLLMIVPTTFSGMSLPLVSRIVSDDIKALGRKIGNVFSLNTIGAVAGALLTGLVLIPIFGIKQSIEFAVLVNGVLGLVILFHNPRIGMQVKLLVTTLFCVTAILYRTMFPSWNENASMVGVYRAFFETAPETYEDFLKGISDRTIIWYKEGMTANVGVTQSVAAGDGRQERSLIINGKADASTIVDLPTQILLAQIPLFLRPDTGDVLVIGLGSGITSGSAIQHPIRSLDCVEISPEVAECNYLFSDANHNFLQDPRSHLFIDDALTYVKINPKHYSCIISEPSNPWIAGIGNLFTKEFFALCKQRLTRDGILAQWFHIYDVNDEVFQLVLRTIRQEFPYVTLWSSTDVDVILVASMSPISPSFARMEQTLKSQQVADELARIKISDVPALLSTQVAAGVSDSLLSAGGSINSEKQPLLEFMAPISLFAHSHVGYLNVIDRRLEQQDTTLFISKYPSFHTLTLENYLNIARFQCSIATDDYRLTYHAVQECLKRDPNQQEALTILAAIAQEANVTEERLSALQRLSAINPDNPVLLSTFAMEYSRWKEATSGDTVASQLELPVRLLQRCIQLTKKQDERYYIDLAKVLTPAKRFQEAAEAYAAALKLRETYQPIMQDLTDDQLAFLAAENYLDANDPADGAVFLNRLKQLNPNHDGIENLTNKLSTEKKGTL